MEALFSRKTGLSVDDLNGRELELDITDIDQLERLIKKEKLPHCNDGFFFGLEYQDITATEYQQQDLDFCTWARKAIKEGYKVCYSCWW